MNHMKNQISALSDPFPILDDLLKNWFGEKKKKTGAGGSWLKYLFIILLMLLVVLFAFCLFHKIIVSCITKCMTEPPTKRMVTRLDTYMTSDCNSVTLDMGRCKEREYFPGP